MANLVRWNPISEMMSLHGAMDRLFEQSFVWPRFWIHPSESLYVPLDVYQTDDAVTVKAALPGVRPEDIDVTFQSGCLTIKGETRYDEEAKREDYYFQERRYGSFCRQIELPATVAPEKAEAVFENGVLTLTLPKAEEAKPKQIKVRATASIEAPKKTETKKK
ncbi:MAG: Hsp20/alpha crystallin family protein [Chloroflexi bacterium]|nr:Hsp20/alpha crystallin family protein [Chloroflexota bacterium]